MSLCVNRMSSPNRVTSKSMPRNEPRNRYVRSYYDLALALQHIVAGFGMVMTRFWDA
jgi:hypothetical protein